MFVKKFEAPSLEQALKMVKSEMGPEALILSTQEKRNGKLFSRRTIEVTAASEKKKIEKKQIVTRQPETRDESIVKIDLEDVFPGRNRDVEKYKAVVAKEATALKQVKAERYIEIDSEKISNSQLYVAKERIENVKYESIFKHLGITSERSTELSKRMISDFPRAELIDPQFFNKAKTKVLSQGIRTLSPGEFFKKKAWVPIGVTGSGKTTLLVKMAIAAREYEKSVSLISMDNRKFSGRSELAGYARLIKVPFFTEINQASSEKLRLIDSPALSLGEKSNSVLEKLCVERAPIIVLDVSSRLSELMRQIDKAMMFHPEAIAFTKVDNVEECGVIYDVLKATQLPLVGLSVSSSFKTKFKFLTPVELAQFLVKE